MSATILEPLRRWAVEWLSARRPEVCEEILTPGYSILIGGYLLDGREAYIEGTLGQLDRFPGLGVTIHDLIWSGERAAVRFSEHGASAKHGAAAWGGIALFGSDGERLDRCGAEEDYLSRRRQFDTGAPDPVEAPAPAPWSTPEAAPDPAAEAAVRAWLEAPDFEGVTCDDGWRGEPAPIPLEDAEVELDYIFSAGPRVAFHGTRRGRYGGGLDGLEDREGADAELHFAGLVSVADSAVVGGRVVRDRLGLSRALQKVGSR